MLQYAVDEHKASGPHLVQPFGSKRIENPPGEFVFRSETACGKAVFGAMGWSSRLTFVNCAACRRSAQYKALV